MGVPLDAESEEFASFVGEVVKRLEAGKNVVAHCRGGLGRTGMVVACVLVALDEHTSDEAIGVVRKARSGTVQTEEQANFVRQYEVRQRLV
jgi:cyclin-dependent kinase inhibitor 3